MNGLIQDMSWLVICVIDWLSNVLINTVSVQLFEIWAAGANKQPSTTGDFKN